MNISKYKSSKSDFTRDSPLSFPVIVSSMLHLFKESVEFNLSQILPFLGKRIVTGAAFSKARDKIKIDFFKDLNKLQLEAIKSIKPKLWKGFQLLAFDGTTILVPSSKQNKEYFGTRSEKASGTKNCLAQCLLCVDILTDCIYGYKLDKMSVGECTLFKKMIPTIVTENPTICLLDRGFGNYNSVVSLLKESKYFCIRMSVNVSAFAKEVMLKDESDFDTIWIPSEKERINAKKHNLPITPIKVRVSKILLDSGEIELLISNLFDYKAITSQNLKELYFKRWKIEEDIKKIKPKMKIEQWGSRKPNGIFQEFETHIFMYNLTCILGIEAQNSIHEKCKKRELKYKYNWQNGYRNIREKIVDIVFRGNIINNISIIIANMSQSVIAIVDKRKFARNMRRSHKSRAYQTYK